MRKAPSAPFAYQNIPFLAMRIQWSLCLAGGGLVEVSERYTSTRPASRIFFHEGLRRKMLKSDSVPGNELLASRIWG